MINYISNSNSFVQKDYYHGVVKFKILNKNKK